MMTILQMMTLKGKLSPLGELSSISGPNPDSRPGGDTEIRLEINVINSRPLARLKSCFHKKQRATFTIQYPDRKKTAWIFDGYVTEVKDSIGRVTVNVIVTGEVVNLEGRKAANRIKKLTAGEGQ